MPEPKRKGTDRGDFFELPLDTALKLIEWNGTTGGVNCRSDVA